VSAAGVGLEEAVVLEGGVDFVATASGSTWLPDGGSLAAFGETFAASAACDAGDVAASTSSDDDPEAG